MSGFSRTAIGILIVGSVTLALSLGVRHGFGLFLVPITLEFGWSREVFAFAIALQNLIWGIATPFVGVVADRLGAGKVILAGGAFYAAGLVMMSLSDSPGAFTVSASLLIGLGLSGTSFSVILSAVGRAVPPEKRSMALGIASAAGSFGQFAMLPGTLGLIEWLGWSAALLVLGGLVALMMPLAGMVRESPRVVHIDDLSLFAALRQAAGHPGFWLLSTSFFVCGFQVVFIAVHLPTYLLDQGMSVKVGTTVLALVGLFNIFGTYFAGWLGGRIAKPRLLAALHLIRAGVIAVFIVLPLSTWSAYAFGVAMGLMWLSTVPLTYGTVASVFGLRNLTMLSGVVFLFHQFGSFLGGWMGGFVYDRTGSYDLIWLVAIALGVIASLLSWPIREEPIRRPQPVAG